MRPFGLYIHIPFCDGKCYYCSFFSQKRDAASMDEYVRSLIGTVGFWGKKTDRRVTSVYFGGGTPSLLGHERLAGIMNAVKSSFDVAPDAEITIEVNPSSSGGLDYRALLDAGFNRLSIGLQSADDAQLKRLGRRHTVDDVSHTVSAARDAGFGNISLDVMLAIPGQTLASLERTLRFCAQQQVQHISAYILKIEEGTRFFREQDSLGLFSDEDQARLYEYTVNRLNELGYRQYEISNFSLPCRESRHNLLYWHDEEYLGIGPSAHSFIDGQRFFYPDSFDAFYQNKTEYESAGGGQDEYIMLALRLTDGLSFDKYRERYHEELSESFFKAAEELQGSGYAKLTPSSLSLTTRGFLVSNAVIAYLLQNT